MTEDRPTPADVDDADHPYARDLNWLLHRVGAGVGSVQDAVARRHGLTIRSAIVLGTLAESAPLTQLALARQLGLDKTTVVAVLDRLEDAGLIVRRPAPSDRRARVPEATAQGRALASSVRAEIAAADRTTLAALTPDERDRLVDLLHRLAFGPGIDTTAVPGSCI